ncbi:MAG: hypothetical protein AAF849_10225 [Bacteroidota bacterium]
MNIFRTYRLFNVEVAIVIFLSLFVANAKLCFYWTAEEQFELIKMGEQEKENKKESQEERKVEQELSNKEIRLSHNQTQFFTHKGTSFFIWDYFWTHHLEVPTPPPEGVSFPA